MLQSPQTRRVILVINLLLIIWIASILASLTWDLLSPAEVAGPVEVVADAAPVAVNPDRQLISQIPGWHLMGVADQRTPVQPTTAVAAPETKLKLILRGVLAADDPEKAHAMIADPRGKELQYGLGDKLPGNAELSEVHPDRIILKRNGRFETLRLPKTEKGKTTRVASRSVSAGRTAASPQQRLSNARKQLGQSPVKLSNLIRATPNRGDGG